MNTHDKIELPEHDCLYESTNEQGYIDLEPAYRKSTVLRLLEADRKRIAELESANAELERLCDETYVAQGADAYNLACEEMEDWQAERRKAGKEVGTTGSLCDGIQWLYGYIEELEAKRRGEPVAWRVHPFDYGVGYEGVYALTSRPDQVAAWERKGWEVQPLFTAPQPAEPVSVPKHLIERLRKHCENKDNTAFARSTMREALQYLTAESDRGEPVAWLRNERDGYAGKEIFDPLVILGSAPPIKTANGATYSPVFAAPQPTEPVHETARTAGNGAESGMNNGPKGGAHSASPYSGCGCNSDDCRVNGCLSKRQAQSAMAPGGGGMPAEPVKDGTPLGKALDGINSYFASKKADEPVKVPSDAEIDSLLKEVGYDMTQDRFARDLSTRELFDGFARALLARYGNQTQEQP